MTRRGNGSSAAGHRRRCVARHSRWALAAPVASLALSPTRPGALQKGRAGSTPRPAKLPRGAGDSDRLPPPHSRVPLVPAESLAHEGARSARLFHYGLGPRGMRRVKPGCPAACRGRRGARAPWAAGRKGGARAPPEPRPAARTWPVFSRLRSMQGTCARALPRAMCSRCASLARRPLRVRRRGPAQLWPWAGACASAQGGPRCEGRFGARPSAPSLVGRCRIIRGAARPRRRDAGRDARRRGRHHGRHPIERRAVPRGSGGHCLHAEAGAGVSMGPHRPGRA